MSERVFVVVSMYENAELLPHFLAHYTRLGVHQILVAVRSQQRGDLYDLALSHAAHYPAHIYWFPSRQFADSDKTIVQQSLLERHGIAPDDYVMHLDLDEFHEYPAPLAAIVREMNRRDDWAVRGWILDRIAEDGALAAIQAMPSIGEQFPIGCHLTGSLLNAWTQKIVLCRGRVQLQGGVSHDTCNALYDEVPIGRVDQYIVHHFKWTRGVDVRLQKRLTEAAIPPCYADECRRFLKYFRVHGKIDPRIAEFRPRWLGALPYACGGT